jgi:hypothetical protein
MNIKLKTIIQDYLNLAVHLSDEYTEKVAEGLEPYLEERGYILVDKIKCNEEEK